MKKNLLIAFIGLFAFTSDAQIQNYTVGQTVNDFTVTDTKGNSHNLYTYLNAGKHVFLDFFFTTCVPCQQTNPTWNEFYDKYGCNAADVICISINAGFNTDAQVIAYENTYGGSFNHAPAASGDGGSGVVDSDFNPAAYPTYCLIGPDYKLKNSDIWPINSVADFEAAFPAGFNPSPLACSVGLEENEQIVALSISPNPSDGNIKIEIANAKKGSSIEILNILGEKVYTVALEYSSFHNITLTSEMFSSKGIYFVRILNDNYSVTERMLIN